MNEQNAKKELIVKRTILFRKLKNLRDILPGSFSFRKIPCGKSNCRCKRDGEGHDAYQYYCKIAPGKKAFSKMIPKQFSKQVERQVKMNKEFKKVMKEIYAINLKILFNELEDARKK